MVVKTELDKLQQLNAEHKIRFNDAESNVNELELEVIELKDKHTQQVQSNSSEAKKTFKQLNVAEKELKSEQATLEALNVGNSKPMKKQANKTLDAVADELATIEDERTQAIEEYNNVVSDLLVKAEKLKGIKQQSDEAYNQVNAVESEYKPIASERKDFFTRTANNDYMIKHLNMRYRHDSRMIIGHKLDKALSEALPTVTSW